MKSAKFMVLNRAFLFALSVLIAIPLTVSNAAASRKTAATVLPGGYSESVAISGFASPTDMAVANDGRLFVAERAGKVKVVVNGVVQATPVLSIGVDTTGERGLKGIVLDPNFSSNGYLYVFYTFPDSPAHHRVSRFTVVNNVASPQTESVILYTDTLGFSSNNIGGKMAFGKDGLLYIAVGDQGLSSYAAAMNSYFGKVLRIKSDGTIPSNNPYNGTASGKFKAIYATGFRNPKSISVNATDGDIYLTDNGSTKYEEVNSVLPGADYGWPSCEGYCIVTGVTNPVLSIPHKVATFYGTNIGAGVFYHANQFPASMKGDFLFGDTTLGWIKSLDASNGYTVGDFASGAASPTALSVGTDGQLYYLATTGYMYKIRYGTGVVVSPTPIPEKPEAIIDNPISGIKYKAGDTVQFSGTGLDQQDGTLPASAFSWTVDFYHDNSINAFQGPFNNTKSGSVILPKSGISSTNSWYRFNLTVTDSDGNKSSSFVDVFPQVSTMTVKTEPENFTVNVDGVASSSPKTFNSVVGFMRNVSVSSSQTMNGKPYKFSSWTDNGAINHNIETPVNSTSYTAMFTPLNSEVYMEKVGVIVVQANRGTDFSINTRYSNNGINWSGWTMSGYTFGDITMKTINGKLFQAVRGSDQGIYTRYTVNGSDWTPWTISGWTYGDVTMETFNGRLYQSIRGTNNGIYTRYTVDGDTWSNWELSGGTLGEVSLYPFLDKLVQAVRGTNDVIYTRYTQNGIDWTDWVGDGMTYGTITQNEFRGMLYQSIRGTDNGVYTRFSPNGIGWTGWTLSGYCLSPVSMVTFNGRQYQAIRGTDNGLYLRFTDNGAAWSPWFYDGTTNDDVKLAVFNDRLIESARGTDNAILTRSADPNQSWTGFNTSGLSLSAVTTFKYDNGKVIQAVRGTDNNIYSRVSPNGVDWYDWLK